MQDFFENNIAGQIASKLAERIIVGDIPPKTPLRQDSIAEDFKTSHVPVREAFRLLEAQDLVVSEPRKGVRVAPLNAHSIMELSEMRAALEALALRDAIPNMTKSDIEKIESLVEEDEAADPEDIISLEKLNRAFHSSLAQPCQRLRLQSTIQQLRLTSSRILLAMWRQLPKWQTRSSSEHREILNAVKTQQVDLAIDLLTQHIIEGGKTLSEMVHKNIPPDD
ncbi:MAG: GntR family transcriptional regulator [Emcibacteraceae bacterium]|nr:GntR family transcriptional regulator [Emcibacteraceae bacterium]